MKAIYMCEKNEITRKITKKINHFGIWMVHLVLDKKLTNSVYYDLEV